MTRHAPLRHSGLVERNYLRNRTIVSSDIGPLLEDVAATAGHELVVHRYPSGSDIGTWIVPPRWDVKEAWLKGPDGALIASYADHPLFSIPYTQPFSGRVDHETLKRHVLLHPTQDDAFFYEHRFAYDYRKRLTDWAITLPRTLFNRLRAGEYTVHLDYDIADGEMLVGELCLPGATGECIALLTDYCHPGQVNDSFTGILAMLDVFERLKVMENRRYTYRLFFFPETIGSCVLLHARPDYAADTRLAIFSEFVGWGRNWKVLAGGDANGLSGKLGRQIALAYRDVRCDGLADGFGNDEAVFDFAGIPSLSVQMSECDEYHSSLDRPELIEPANVERAADIVFSLCRMMEENRVLRLGQRVPVYLTRYGLYSDSVYQSADFEKNRTILYGLRDGRSLLDIAAAAGIEFAYVRSFAATLAERGLLETPLPDDDRRKCHGN